MTTVWLPGHREVIEYPNARLQDGLWVCERESGARSAVGEEWVFHTYEEARTVLLHRLYRERDELLTAIEKLEGR